MDDSNIIEMYWQRNENAIEETNKKYGKYCFTIANNILASKEDSDECVNDTWLRAWNVIPPKKPDRFRAFLGKITRNLSFDRYKHINADKRKGEMLVIMEELAECVSGQNTTDEMVDAKVLGESISGFLRTLSARDRSIFLSRYFYAAGVAEIAQKYDMTANNVSVSLSRTRTKLREHLKEEGFEI